MGGRKWTAEEDAYLEASWSGSEETAEIAEHLDRSLEAIRLRANSLGLVSRVYWTAEENSILREGYARGESPKTLAKHLDRTIGAIHAQAERLELVSKQARWTEEELEYLKSSWSLKSSLEISKVIPHSVLAILRMVTRLELVGGRKRVSLAQRNGEFVRCATCGKVVYKRKSLIREQNFCSRKCTQKMLIRLQSPNKSELALDSLIQKEFPGEYKFNGDYSQGVTLGGLIPDWVNVNGRKQVIELFGEYWHDRLKDLKWKSTEFGRKAVFSQLGFDCLIIWSKELRHTDEVIKKIEAFREGI